MSKIVVTVIKTFPVSGRNLCLTEEAGSLTGGVHKDGAPLTRSFSDGAVALQNSDGSCACGPVDFWAAVEFAGRIVEGDPRAITEPGSALLLATALLGASMAWPLPTAPVSVTEEAA